MIITEISIVIGMLVMILVGGLMKDMEIYWRDGLIESNLGQIQIMAKGLRKEESTHKFIKNINEFENEFKQFPEIQKYTYRINIGGLISTGENTSTFFGYGIDPGTALETLPQVKDMLIKGDFIEPDDIYGTLLGKGVAEKLKVEIGDTLFLERAVQYAVDKFAGKRITKVITSAVDGIPLATLLAHRLGVKLVIAKKDREVGVREFIEEVLGTL